MTKYYTEFHLAMHQYQGRVVYEVADYTLVTGYADFDFFYFAQFLVTGE